MTARRGPNEGGASDEENNEHRDPDDAFRERNGSAGTFLRAGTGIRQGSIDTRPTTTASMTSRSERGDQYKEHGSAMSSEKKLHYHLDQMQAAFQYTPTDVQEKFFKAQKRSQRLQSTPNFQEKMILYSLFQQSTVGDPPPIDDEEFSDLFGAQKREAWLRLRGRGKEQTMKGYISYVEELGNKYGWMLDGEKIGESLFDESLLQSAF